MTPAREAAPRAVPGIPEPVPRSVAGQGEAYRRVLVQARSLRLPHGLLVTGPPGTGKSVAAHQIAAALLCSEPGLEDACGACRTCRRVAAGQHPDLHVLQLPEDRRDIPVELVRELQESLTRLPMEGRARVVVIDPADRLNEQGQNALLKTLEEPGGDTFLLLATARPEGLRETLRSRVQRLRLRPLEDALLAELIRGEYPDCEEDLARVLPLARGALGRALGLLGEEARQTHGLVVGFLAGNYPSGPVALARELLHGAEGRAATLGRARLGLFLLAAGTRGRLASAGVDTYPARAFDAWTASLELLFDAEADLDLQIPPEQVLVNLFLRWPRPAP